MKPAIGKLSGFCLAGILAAFFLAPAFAYEGILAEEEVKGSLETIRLNEILNRYLATIEMYDPERATLLGLHGSDALLTRRNKEQQSKTLEVFRSMREKIKEIDKDSLMPEMAVDYEILDNMLETDVYDIKNSGVLEKNPGYYLRPLYVIYLMLNRDYENYNIRAANALARVKLAPKVLLEAEHNLSHPPKIWTLDAIKQADAAANNIHEFLPLFSGYTRYDPLLKTQVNDAMLEIKTALERYRDFLKREVLKSSDGDFRVGEFAYGFYLERWHGLDITPRKARSLAKDMFKKSMKELKEEAGNINPLTYDARGWYGVYENLPFEYPALGEILRIFQSEMVRAYQHFDEFKVVKFPKQRVLLKEMPAFMKTFKSYVEYVPSFGLDPEMISELYVSLPDSNLSKTALEEILKSAYSYAQTELLVAHSLMPGLQLQNWQANQNPSRFRKISRQPFINSGWALYSEKLAEEMGFYTYYYSKFLRLYYKTLRGLRAWVDALLHQKKITRQEAVKMFMDEMHFSRERAEREILQISYAPTENFGAILVYDRILRLRARQKKEGEKYFSLRKFHTNFLYQGSIPVDMVEEEIERIALEEAKIINERRSD